MASLDRLANLIVAEMTAGETDEDALVKTVVSSIFSDHSSAFAIPLGVRFNAPKCWSRFALSQSSAAAAPPLCREDVMVRWRTEFH